MIAILKQSLWKHFGGSIDMLHNAINAWPEAYWTTDKRFFYMAYHCVVFLDYYLTIPPIHFSPPLPFTLTEQDQIPKEAIDDVVPDCIYSKKELLDYLEATREKCRGYIGGLTDEQLQKNWLAGPESPDMTLASGGTLTYSVLDILLYNMKHVQHHSAQLNLLLRQKINKAPDYVSMAKDDC